jgi:thioredoxin-related protein
MKKRILFSLAFTIISFVAAHASDSLYHPLANAKKDIAAAISKAKKEKKFVLVQAGGNWCSWCIEFNRFTTTDKQLDSAINADYVVYHLNYSPQVKNFEVFKQYGFPNRFGFPVFLILDGNGKLVHTQNSSYLEEKKSYSKTKVMDFLESWKPQVFEESNYGYLKN